MLTPEQEEVVVQVVTKMAGPPTPWRESKHSRKYQGTHWWLDHEELLSEAMIACMTTDVLTGATSLGAFHVRLRDRLKDTQKTDRKWREERTESIKLTDVDLAPRTTAPEDNRGAYVPGERSELLETRASMTKDEFVAWADEQLGTAWGKKRDVRALLYGTSAQQAELWTKYAKGKRVTGGKRVMIDGAQAAEGDYQETLAEEWTARYRWNSDGLHPLVMSADGQTVVVARMLRQPVR